MVRPRSSTACTLSLGGQCSPDLHEVAIIQADATSGIVDYTAYMQQLTCPGNMQFSGGMHLASGAADEPCGHECAHAPKRPTGLVVAHLFGRHVNIGDVIVFTQNWHMRDDIYRRNIPGEQNEPAN
jgi:hypothetical protein